MLLGSPEPSISALFDGCSALESQATIKAARKDRQDAYPTSWNCKSGSKVTDDGCSVHSGNLRVFRVYFSIELRMP
jgi:hypothetical protein